jgi:hypothetical protein
MFHVKHKLVVKTKKWELRVIGGRCSVLSVGNCQRREIYLLITKCYGILYMLWVGLAAISGAQRCIAGWGGAPPAMDVSGCNLAVG